MKRNSFLVFLVFFLASCSNKSFNTAEELTDYINDEDNGFKISKNINGVEYSLVCRPTDLLVKQELGTTKKNDKQDIEKLRKKYNKSLYFNLTMSLNKKELLTNVVVDKERFARMLNDLTFIMNEKIHLYTIDKDTIKMIDFIYPRMYGTTTNTSLLIIYPKAEKYLTKDYLNFTIEDLGLNTGEVRFKIDTKSLQNQPQLKFY